MSTLTLSTTWNAMFMGYAPIDFSAAVVKFYCGTLHNWTTSYVGTYMAVGLYKGEFLLGRNISLERIYSRDITAYISATATPPATTGIKRVVLGGNTLAADEPLSVSAGTPIWVVFGYYAGTGGTGTISPTLLSANYTDIGFSARRVNSYATFASSTSSLTSNAGEYFVGVPVAQTVVSPCLSITYYSSQAAAFIPE